MGEYVLIAAGACVCGLLIVALRNSKALGKLVANALLGLAAMGTVNLAAFATGTGLGVNVFSLLVAALLGAPGVIGLMFLRVIWKI